MCNKMVAITGGAGFVGSNIIRYLNKKGINDIDIYDNLNSISKKWRNLADLNFRDLYDSTDIYDKINVNNYEYIIHFGATSKTSTKPEDFRAVFSNNHEFTKRLLSAFSKNNHSKKIIFASSASVYGDCMDFTERTNNLVPLNWYGETKLISDRYLERCIQVNPGKEYYSLRLFNVYGPGEKHKCLEKMASPISRFLYENAEKHCIYTSSRQMGRDFIYVENVADVVYHCLELGKNMSGIYNVGSGVASAWVDVLKHVCEIKEKAFDQSIIYEKLPSYHHGYYQYYTRANLSKLRGESGFNYQKEFTPLKEGISRTFDLDFT